MPIDRREFVGGTVAATLMPGVHPESHLAAVDAGPCRLYWGDLHNHNRVGYAKGSLERSIELAQEHLDFFAFTGHASWHDMPKMPGDRHMKWVRGFDVHSRHWFKTRQLIREANSDTFAAFLGYEWHSSRFGDYCMIFPEDQPSLYLPDHVDKLLDFADAQSALAIPHHVGYKQGWRGANFSHFRRSTSPVVEIFSEHGCSESTRSPEPFIRHSMSGRSTANTITRQLANGLRFGFVASSDDHRGYPGAYGEGVVGVWAHELTPRSILDAIRARRTYAATGDRIELEFALNGQPMGAELPATRDRQMAVRVEGQDAIAMVEVLRSGRVVHRHFPEDEARSPLKLPGRVKCRIRYGWGPWAALNLGRTCHWEMTIQVEGGRFHRAVPCFQSAPFDENLRDKLRWVSDRELRLASQTTRVQCYSEDPTKAIVCELDAQPNAVLTLRLKQPVEQTVSARLSDLIRDNVIAFTGEFTSESCIIEQLVGPGEYAAEFTFQDRDKEMQDRDWYYVRVTQHNGQLAWSSPIWVG